MNLTTLAQVKALLELTETDWDALIEELIAAVSGRAGTYCNRDFEQQGAGGIPRRWRPISISARVCR